MISWWNQTKCYYVWLWFRVNFVLLLSVMNYCRASFEIVTRIRQMAPLLYIINFSKLRFRVRNETTLISAKNRVDLSSISEVRSYITVWPHFFGPPCILLTKRFGKFNLILIIRLTLNFIGYVSRPDIPLVTSLSLHEPLSRCY